MQPLSTAPPRNPATVLEPMPAACQGQFSRPFAILLLPRERAAFGDSDAQNWRQGNGEAIAGVAALAFAHQCALFD
jgi:hypothetical protein